MLEKLSVKNVALIESAEIEFAKGLNVLSGETGSGKSVLLDSLNFVLGAKADRSMIRYGENECFVKAEFSVPKDSLALNALSELDIESDGEIIISRKFDLSGKNAIKINGNAVSATMLKSVTDKLVDVHGQSEHFFLLSEGNQLKLLDSIIGDGLKTEKAALSVLLTEYGQINENLEKLGGDEEGRNRKLALLKFQIDEIKGVDLKDGEEEELAQKRLKIQSLEKIMSALNEAQSYLSDENGALECLRKCKRAVSRISTLGDEYENLSERLESLSDEADDIAETLSSLCDLSFDEEEANYVEQRLDSIKALKRKYGANKAEIDEFLASSEQEYDLLSDASGQYDKLTVQKEKTEKEIYSVCQQITTKRKRFGTEFCKNVSDELKTLNIPNATFLIEFDDYTLQDAKKATKNGLDSLRFMFSANAGEPVKPLGKIISGGEMSRFMLSIKTQLTNVNGISTYVFDEIDAGISGKTAKVVAEKFVQIAQNTQVIAVSHLPQIVCMSDKGFQIKKSETQGKTLTNVLSLDDEGKIDEIVRLLGDDSSGFAKAHAKEMVEASDLFKNSLNRKKMTE